ncbi:hypothetical protein Gotri_021125, partial [Gossypium trilobum]|nr:hypothetical protein [Gossypium trilobum]
TLIFFVIIQLVLFQKICLQKAGKNEHHLWKKRDSACSGQTAFNLVRIVSLICLFFLYWV